MVTSCLITGESGDHISILEGSRLGGDGCPVVTRCFRRARRWRKNTRIRQDEAALRYSLRDGAIEGVDYARVVVVEVVGNLMASSLERLPTIGERAQW